MAGCLCAIVKKQSQIFSPRRTRPKNPKKDFWVEVPVSAEHAGQAHGHGIPEIHTKDCLEASSDSDNLPPLFAKRQGVEEPYLDHGPYLPPQGRQA